jgi:hypothetical protein
MSNQSSLKRGLLSYSGSAAFKERIAPKIAAHIQKSIDVQVTGEDTCLNTWLVENLSTISPLHITSLAARGCLQRPGKRYQQKKAKYE